MCDDSKLEELAEQVERLSSVVGGNWRSHDFAASLASSDGQAIYAESSLHPDPKGGFPPQHTGQPSTVGNAGASNSSQNGPTFPSPGKQGLQGFLPSDQNTPNLGNRTQELFFHTSSSRSLEHVELNCQQINHLFYQ